MTTLPVLSGALHFLRLRAEALTESYTELSATELLAAVSSTIALLVDDSRHASDEERGACLRIRVQCEPLRKALNDALDAPTTTAMDLAAERARDLLVTLAYHKTTLGL